MFTDDLLFKLGGCHIEKISVMSKAFQRPKPTLMSLWKLNIFITLNMDKKKKS